MKQLKKLATFLAVATAVTVAGAQEVQQLAQCQWRSLEKRIRPVLEKRFLDPRHRCSWL